MEGFCTETVRVFVKLWGDAIVDATLHRHELRRALPNVPPFTGQSQAHLFYTLWNFFTPSFPCPYETARLGTSSLPLTSPRTDETNE